MLLAITQLFRRESWNLAVILWKGPVEVPSTNPIVLSEQEDMYKTIRLLYK